MKKLFALLLSALMLVSLVACTGTTTATTDTTDTAGTATATETTATTETATAQEPATSAEPEGFTPALDTGMEATLYFAGSYGNYEALDQVALNFKEYYPNVEVVYEKLDDYRNDLANRFATGEKVDIFMNAWWDVEYPANQNIIDNAEDLYGAGIDFSNLDAEILATGEADGRLLMAPVYLMCWGGMVNLDILEANGLSVPTSYAELVACCEALQAAGYEHPIYVQSGLYGRSLNGYYMERRMAGSDATAALDETIAMADGLVEAGYVTTEGDDLADTYDAQILRFFEGDVPFMAISTNNYSGTKKREAKSEAFTASPFNYAFIPMAYGEDNTAFINQCGNVYLGVYKDSPNLELANEFLRFLLTDEQLTVMGTIKNMPTASTATGLADFPYLAAADLVTASADGISTVDEERALNVLAKYHYGDDHGNMYELLADYIENGIR